MQQVPTDALMSPAAEQNPLNQQTSLFIINSTAHFIHQLFTSAQHSSAASWGGKPHAGSLEEGAEGPG